MPRSLDAGDQQRTARRRLRFSAAALSAGVAGVAMAVLAGLALAKATTLVVAHNVKVHSKTESVVANSHGITVYALSDETTKPHHVKLTCTKASGCFNAWFPVTVPSAGTKLSAATGIKGKLGTLHRNGFFQVTLGQKPLYTFIGDEDSNHKPIKGIGMGDNLQTFGGVWHVIAVSAAKKSITTTTTTMTTTTTCAYPPYC